MDLFEIGQYLAIVLAVIGTFLNNAQRRTCFFVWFISNIICLYYHAVSNLWGLAGRDVLFLILNITGWYQWGIKKKGPLTLVDMHKEPTTEFEVKERIRVKGKQVGQAMIKAWGIKITCPCGTTVSIWYAHKCWVCGIHFCRDCGKKHFK